MTEYERWPDPQPITGSIAEGYPCPKCGARLSRFLLEGWACRACDSLWWEIGEVDMADLDALPDSRGADG